MMRTQYSMRRILRNSVLAGACLLGFAVLGNTTREKAPIEKKVKTPGEVASQLCVILANGKMPWQIYGGYTDIFVGYARRVEMQHGGTRKLRKNQQRLVQHYRQMAGLLQQMQSCAEIRDGIKQNRTDIPFGKRTSTYREQRKRHGELLRQFADMGSKLPGFQLPKVPSRER